MFGAFVLMDFPAHNQAAVHIHHHVQAVKLATNGSGQERDVPAPGSQRRIGHPGMRFRHRPGRLGATAWLWTYNNERPNMALGGITPRQKLASKYLTDSTAAYC